MSGEIEPGRANFRGLFLRREGRRDKCNHSQSKKRRHASPNSLSDAGAHDHRHILLLQSARALRVKLLLPVLRQLAQVSNQEAARARSRRWRPSLTLAL